MGLWIPRPLLILSVLYCAGRSNAAAVGETFASVELPFEAEPYADDAPPYGEVLADDAVPLDQGRSSKAVYLNELDPCTR